MTPAQVLATIRNQVFETEATFWSDAEIYQYMWEAEQELAALIGGYQLTTTAATVVNQQEYSRPSGCLVIRRLTYDGTKLKKIDFLDQDFLEGDTVSAGEPANYWEYGDIVGLVPKPSAIGTLKYFYDGDPAQITVASTSFSVPSMLSKHLTNYCLYRMFAKDQDDSRTRLYLDLWERAKITAQQEWARRQYKDRVMQVIDEDAYPTTDLGIA